MTYQQAYDKIIQAYFRDEIKPMDNEFCFCGTLSPDSDWRRNYHRESYPYTAKEYELMEWELLRTLTNNLGVCYGWEEQPNYEQALFEGMTAALEVLKQIHRERGEDVDSLPALTKRNLQPTL